MSRNLYSLDACSGILKCNIVDIVKKNVYNAKVVQTRTRSSLSLSGTLLFYSSFCFSLPLSLYLTIPTYISLPSRVAPSLSRCFVSPSLVVTLSLFLSNTSVHPRSWLSSSLLYRPYFILYPSFSPRRGTFRPLLRGFKARSASVLPI